MRVNTPGGTFINPGSIKTRQDFKLRLGILAVLGSSMLCLSLPYLGVNRETNTALVAAPVISPTPTVDSLAEPALPPDPSQAELGTRAYWLNCMPCHGDRGQGLTDEFRNLYPEEDRNCWASGCHGGRPYKDGFTLPTSVPPLIGPQALGPFDTAASLHTFISSAMPYQARGSLDEDTYWQITAFLLRENGKNLPNEPLGPENASLLRLGPPGTAVASDPSENGPSGGQGAVGSSAPTPGVIVHVSDNRPLPPVSSLALGALLILGLALLLKKRKAGRP